MTILMDFVRPFLSGTGAFAWLAEGAIKGTAVLAIAGLLALVFQRGSAARRHLIWACALAMIAAMPALLGVLPTWTVRSAALAWMAPIDPAPAPAPSMAALAGDAGERAAIASATSGVPRASTSARERADAPAAAKPVADPSRTPTASTRGELDWRALGVVVWVLGALLVAAIFALGHVALRVLLRDARHVRSGEWRDLALEAADRLRLTLPFALLQSPRVPVPVAFGLLRPRVVLPADADAWPLERRRSVLLHELAHVQRHDCLTQLVAQVACALFWFHPAVWAAAARLRVERERACDDRVLAARTVASDYADHLLDVVRSLRATRLAGLGAVAFARRSSLEGRLIAVLDPARDRRAVRFRAAAFATALAALVLLPLAALQPARLHAGSKHAGAGRSDAPINGQAGRPSRLERPEMGGSLEEGIAWAQDASRRAGDRAAWIGWRIGTPSRRGGGLLGDTEGIDLRWLGAEGVLTLDDVLAGREQGTSNRKARPADDHRPLAILLRSIDGSLVRVRVQSLDLPAEFAREPLYWLDEIPTEQTFAWLKAEAARTRDVKLRARLVESVGYLDRSDLVRPYLHATLDGGDAGLVRAGAAEAIGRHPSAEGLRLLLDRARRDPHREVRRASIEALGNFQTPEALEALLALARADDNDGSTRRQVFDVMGNEVERRAGEEFPSEPETSKRADDLAAKRVEKHKAKHDWDSGPPDEPSVALDREDHETQRQAIESLGRYPEDQSLRRLKRIVETSPNSDLRREAIESLARIGTPAAIAVVREAAWRNRHPQARITAVEKLARVLPAEEALDQLEELAKSHPSRDTRRQAIETIGRIEGGRAAQILEATIRHGQDPEGQRQAVESLGRREGAAIDERLLEVARSHPVQDVRRQAVETIGRRGGGKAIDRLLSIVRDDGPEDVRRQAVESIGRLDDSRVKATLLELARHGGNPEVERQAVESLGRIEEDTIPELAEIARSHPSGNVRRQAVETMTRRDPDRALPILEEILRQPSSRKRGGA